MFDEPLERNPIFFEMISILKNWSAQWKIYPYIYMIRYIIITK